MSPSDYLPFTVGERLRLVPPGTAPTADRTDIVMARGAFGSGEHETTATCLEEIEGLDSLSGASVLDVGSGTGILAIACLKLGATSAVCVDISPRAVQSAKLNTELNGVAGQVEHVCGELGDVRASRFDLVLANIYGDLILAMSDALIGRVRPGGLLLLSGILWQDRFAVTERLSRLGCRLLKDRMLEEYCTLVATTAA